MIGAHEISPDFAAAGARAAAHEAIAFRSACEHAGIKRTRGNEDRRSIVGSPAGAEELAKQMFVLMANAGLRYEFFIFKIMKTKAPKKIGYAQLLRLIDPRRGKAGAAFGSLHHPLPQTPSRGWLVAAIPFRGGAPWRRTWLDDGLKMKSQI